MRLSTREHPVISRLGAVALIGTYLSAIVIANLTVAWFGPSVVIVNALILVSLDLTARDRLHQAWESKGLAWKMGLLIIVGSALSAALDYAALPVAIASCLAFATAATVDTVVYSFLGGRPWFVKANGSNVASALIDSLVFLSVLAFYGLLPWSVLPFLVAGQWLAKVGGGLAWSLILARRSHEKGNDNAMA